MRIQIRLSSNQSCDRAPKFRKWLKSREIGQNTKNAQKAANFRQIWFFKKLYLAITPPPLDGEKQAEQTAPKREELPEGAGLGGEAVVQRLDNEDLEAPVDNGQNKVIESLVASVQHLQGELVTQKALVAKQVSDTSKLHVASFVQKTHLRDAEKKAAMDLYHKPYQQGIKR